MFAGAAREVVFSNPEVVRQVNEDFIPVALKAGLVNHPPRGIEGELYAEIGRSKPAPQGICTLHSSGKVLTWALSFDNEAAILKFLDHVSTRYKNSSAQQPVVAERYMKFPSRKLADVLDNKKEIAIPERHDKHDRCPALPTVPDGTLVGRIIGRPLGDDGKPKADTIRQEHYMEARFEISVAAQNQLASAVQRHQDDLFQIPDRFTRELVSHAYLGQLDVNPMGGIPGSQNDHRQWKFQGQIVPTDERNVTRIRLEGESHIEGGQIQGRNLRTDGRLWEHRVSLIWQGYLDLKDGRVTRLTMLANGHERLTWGNDRFNWLAEADVEHLMAGHKIDLESAVIYGLTAKPAPEKEVVRKR